MQGTSRHVDRSGFPEPRAPCAPVQKLTMWARQEPPVAPNDIRCSDNRTNGRQPFFEFFDPSAFERFRYSGVGCTPGQGASSGSAMAARHCSKRSRLVSLVGSIKTSNSSDQNSPTPAGNFDRMGSKILLASHFRVTPLRRGSPLTISNVLSWPKYSLALASHSKQIEIRVKRIRVLVRSCSPALNCQASPFASIACSI